jgi:hypothetical protein
MYDEYSHTLFIHRKIVETQHKCCIRDCTTLNLHDAYEQRSNGVLLKIYVHRLQVSNDHFVLENTLPKILTTCILVLKPQHRWAVNGQELNEV